MIELHQENSEPDTESDEYESDSDQKKTRSDEDLRTMIWSTLQRLQTPSAFAYSTANCVLPNPGLHLPYHGIIRLPLSADDAEILIAEASQSSVARQGHTVIDQSVRKSWELSPNQFSIKNPDWNKAIDTILETVCVGLCIREAIGKVSAQLSKLLLYEPGAYFRPQKYGEKAPGLFATLAVCLPSPHEGGKLVLTHDNQRYEYNSATFSNFSNSYAAWYSDITHEVRPITSGYRFMLTYNLIRQSNFVIPSFDFGLERVQQLTKFLEQYNSIVEKRDGKLPPILLHKLKHKYSQADLKLDSLKSHDLTQVQTLVQAASKLGFGTYLATLQLKVKTDEECEGFEEREQVLQNVVELDGTLVVESFDYPNGGLIDPKPQDSGEPDEVKHEGWTGSEGTPVVIRWYRDTVVMLVPPSKQISFVFGFGSYTVIIPLFEKLIKEFSKDHIQKPKLVRLCKRALKFRPMGEAEPGSEVAESMRPFFKQAATTALDIGRFDLYDGACEKSDNKIMLHTATLLGRWAASIGLAAMCDRLMKGVKSASSVTEKLDFLQAVAEGFKSVAQEPNSAERINFQQWSDEALFTALAEPSALATKADGRSLAELSRTINWSLFQWRATPVIPRALTKVKIAFVNELMSAQPELYKEQELFVEIILNSIWEEFAYDSPMPKSVPPGYKDDLNESDLITAIENSFKILPTNCLETTIIPALIRAVPKASKERSKEVFIPLVRMILKNEFPGLRLPNNDAFPPTLHKCLVQAFLIKYLMANVGLAPQAPKSWSIPARSCSCKDCSIINTFLKDPVKQSFDFPCAKPRRHHLHQTFTDSGKAFYDVETIRGRSPNVWRITKHRRGYQKLKYLWDNNTKTAIQTLTELKSEEPVRGRLESYLEPYYSVIMNASVKELPDLDALVDSAYPAHKRAAIEYGDDPSKRTKLDVD